MKLGHTEIRIVQGDITKQSTDAIVNAANPSLMGGGGVDMAIHQAGGRRILEECREIIRSRYPFGLPTGEAVITSGGNLNARHVIHTVGPVWRGGNDSEAKMLYNAYWNSLRVAKESKVKTISFSSISTGAYGYPIVAASKIAVKAVKEFIDKEDYLIEVVFVLFSREDYEIYRCVINESL
jgi:O-acetyl-ADP-ribose deacetylase (regulator of RNase III)